MAEILTGFVRDASFFGLAKSKTPLVVGQEYLVDIGGVPRRRRMPKDLVGDMKARYHMLERPMRERIMDPRIGGPLRVVATPLDKETLQLTAHGVIVMGLAPGGNYSQEVRDSIGKPALIDARTVTGPEIARVPIIGKAHGVRNVFTYKP